MLARRLATSSALIILVGSCNTMKPMEVPRIGQASLIEVHTPKAKQASFALDAVVADIKPGTTVFHFPAGGIEGRRYYCNYNFSESRARKDWLTGAKYLGKWNSELGKIFYETLSSRGLNVAGDPKDLFQRSRMAESAEYRVAARISEIRGNLCHMHYWWGGIPLYEFSGEIFLDIEWTIFSSLIQRKVLTVKTQGYFRQDQPRKSGIELIFYQAFADATEKLLASREFVDIATVRKPEGPVSTDLPVRLFRARTPSKRKLSGRLETIRPSVVTVRVGTGHGSGFVISEDGLVLTNQHVVGGARRVAIVMDNGVEVTADVLARHEMRDVALIKMPVRVPSYLPLRTEMPRILERVFVIGTPLKEGLRSTATSGVVSAIRVDRRTGLGLIQADAAISPGNSGGPLFDESGNVIGISVSTYSGETTQNLNNFIPIGEALKALNLEPKLGAG